MKISKKFMFQPCFEFYVDLLRDMVNGKAPRYNILNSAGGRNCGKTYSFSLFVSLLFYYKVPAIVYAFRKPSNEVEESIWKEILTRLEDAKITGYKVKKTGYTISSPTTTVICMGLYNAKGENIIKKGIAGSSRYLYAIKWFEEANQYEEIDIQSINLAIRGAKHLIKVSTTNPDKLHNYYITYLNKKYPFNKELLLRYGYQQKYFSENKELFHYSNWRVNPFITKEAREEIESLKIKSPADYAIASIGMPESLKEEFIVILPPVSVGQ